MKKYKNIICISVAVVLVASSVFAVGRTNFGNNVKDFVSGLFGRSDQINFSDEVRLPERPYILDSGDKNLNDISVYLKEQEVTAEKILIETELERQILSTDSLDSIADTKREADNLKKVKDELKILGERVESDPDIDDSLKDRIFNLENKIESLFSGGIITQEQFESFTALMGIWTKEDKAILRWSPQMDWIPDNGYDLYRVLTGDTRLLYEGIGNENEIQKASLLKTEFAEYIKPLYDNTRAGTEILEAAGVNTQDEFNEYILKLSIPVLNKYRFSGETDFELQRVNTFTIKEKLVQRAPPSDLLFSDKLKLNTQIKTLPLSINYIKQYGSDKIKVEKNFADNIRTDDLVMQVMQSRNDFLTKANTDIEFANASGFGYEDDLKGLNIEKNTEIEYILVPKTQENGEVNLSIIMSGSRPEGVYSTKIKYGVETPLEKPEGLMGYGADNVVKLRWTPPADQYAKSIISGYYIERKANKENKFTAINDVPVTISYMTDEYGILYEMPTFYSDLELKNGEKAAYRIRALDIFGRLSEYSDIADIAVYKIAPPNTPNIDQPVLSTDNLDRVSDQVKEVAQLNEGVTGIIVPITKTSDDSKEFVIYRSRALGNRQFENPVQVARVEIFTPKKVEEKAQVVRYKRVQIIVNPFAENEVHTIFFDRDISEGYYYKYWVAAVDDFGNESPWSSGRVIGYPTAKLPDKPGTLSIELKRNVLPELILDVPGFSYERIITGNEDKSEEDTESTTGSEYTPVRKTEYSLRAKEFNVSIGVSISDIVKKEDAIIPDIVAYDFGNLPDVKDIHDIIALHEEDLLSGGMARVSWYHFAGEGLKGYHVYRAYADDLTDETLSSMSLKEVTENFTWVIAGKNVQQNMLTENVEQKPGRTYLYLVFLAPEIEGEKDELFGDAFKLFEPGGWMYLNWEASNDPQTGYYRVYRSEVPYFTEEQNGENLEWTLVGDNIKYSGYSEKVDQTFAHYYYFKITSVSLWGIESESYEMSSFRVPSTSPPQTPSMLLPFSQKGKVQVQWAGVPHASQYILYKTKLPKIDEKDISNLELISPDLFKKVFTPVVLKDSFISDRMFKIITPDFNINTDIKNTEVITQKSTMPFISKFNTVELVSKKDAINNISQVQSSEKIDLYKNITKKYGVLAVAPYGQLDLDMAKLVVWDKIAEIDIPLGEDSSGVIEYVDEDVLFGDTYLYTVQAKNDDNLYSGRPDPVSVSPRKSEAFPPVTGVSGSVNELAGNKPELKWNTAKDPNLSWEKSREHIAGYIVYKSNSQNGTYYQQSELLTEPTFIDRNADVYAQNWYKIKVVDTGGYISDFSEAVKVSKLPLFLIPINSIKKIIQIPKINIIQNTNEVSTGYNAKNMAIVIKPVEPIIVVPLVPNTLTINGFTVSGLSQITVTSGKGDGVLKIGDKFEVDVTVDILKRSGTNITSGSVTLKQPVTFGNSGVYFKELNIETGKAGALVSGYVKSTGEGNLIGDLFALTFENEEMNTAGVIKIKKVPAFHYDNLTFKGASMATINLTGITQPISEGGTSGGLVQIPPIVYGSSFISLLAGVAENNLDLEILDNKGLDMYFDILGFDSGGNLSGKMEAKEVQTVRTVVPAGLGIKISKAVLVFNNGIADNSKSNISGKVLLPFNTFADSLPAEFNPDLFLNTYSDKKTLITDIKLHNKITSTQNTSLNLELKDKVIVDRGMYYVASRIQSNSLKVLPMDLAIQEKLSNVPFNVTKWSGKGFVVEETTMTPALVGIPEEEIGVTPGKVALDLSRKASYSGKAPLEAKDNDWMGIVVKNGRVGLPGAFIRTDDNERVMFNLSQGELLYDRNGVFYQNLAYSAEGIPVNFDEALGGFKDVIANMIYLDIYNNVTNLEIQGEVGIPFFGYQKANFRLYTSKELGKIVCSVAPTEKFDPSGTGKIFIKINSGHFQKDGLHMDGSLDLVFDEKIVARDLIFTELIVPSEMDLMTEEKNIDELYGRALFDKPYRVKFHDFEMDVRAISLDNVSDSLQVASLRPVLVTGYKRELKLEGIATPIAASISYFKTTLTIWGGMQLSDNLTMDNNEDFDRIVIGNAFISPEISYEESKSKLDFSFEDFISVQTVATPVISENDGIIEYNTDTLEMAFNTVTDLMPSDIVEANVRLGFDKTLNRYFFALAIYYHDPTGGIKFGIASMNDITGVIGYNLDLNYSDENGYEFPEGKKGFFDSIDDLEVNRTPGGNYFFAATAFIYLGYETESVNLKLGEIRNVYIVVEKGPTIEMGGKYYGPSTVQSIMTGKDYKHMGTARLGYYHNERLFKFSLSLYDFGMYGCTVNGDLGFEMSPKYWEIRVGYPEMLVAQMGMYTGGFGFAMRYSDYPNDSFIRARMQFSYDTGDITISPVYFRAYLFAGGEGEYYFDSGNLVLMVFIEGGLEGGIKVAGKKFRIIHMTVGADGKLTRYSGNWSLDANVRIRYHLDLFLKTVSGSVNWHVSKSF